MNSCRTVRELMEQARDERLPALVQAALDSHLGSCPDCARLAVLESQLSEGFAALRVDADDIEVPLDFRRQVKERLLAAGRSQRSAPSRWANGFTAGLAAAACLVLAVVAVFALRGGGGEMSPARIAGTGPSTGLQGGPAASLGDPALLNSRTAPLLYASPDVEVVYDGAQRRHSDSQAMQPAAAVPEEEEPQSGSGRREYHF